MGRANASYAETAAQNSTSGDKTVKGFLAEAPFTSVPVTSAAEVYVPGDPKNGPQTSDARHFLSYRSN